MATDIIIYRDEQYYLVGESILIMGEDTDNCVGIPIVAICKIETANINEMSKLYWVWKDTVLPMPSGIDYRASDWQKGVKNASSE